jgi:hypothetical protein
MEITLPDELKQKMKLHLDKKSGGSKKGDMKRFVIEAIRRHLDYPYIEALERIYSRDKGDGTIEDMNELAKFLLNNGYAALQSEKSGFQESSYALRDYDVYILRVKKPEAIKEKLEKK